MTMYFTVVISEFSEIEIHSDKFNLAETVADTDCTENVAIFI